MSLQDVKTLLEIESPDRDNLLTLIIGNVERQLLSRLSADNVPDELSYIVTEVAVMRFNRLGSEGMESESVEGHSVKYRGDDFTPYESAIDAYLNRYREPERRVVRFI